MQKAAQSWIAKAVAGVLIVVLVLFGFGAFNLFALNEPIVATVNGEDITERRLAGEIEQTKAQYREAYADQVTEEQLDLFVTEEFALKRLIDNELFMQATRELDLTMSDLKFEQSVQENPQFQNEGEFDSEVFQQSLARAGISMQTLRRAEEDSEVRRQLLSAIEDTAFATDSGTRMFATFENQTRDISTLEFKVEDFEEAGVITEEDLQTHYDLFKSDFVTAGTFDFEYIELTRDMFIPDTDISEDDLRQLYEDELQAKAAEAQRNVAHILIEVGEDRTQEDAMVAIREIEQRLAAGENFDDLASSLSDDAGSKEDGGSLGFNPRDAFVKPFADVAWSLDVDEVSPPVETVFGIHLIKLIEVEAVDHESFEERREALREMDLEQRASEELKVQATAVDKLAFEQSDSLQPIADEYSVDVQTVVNVGDTSTEGVLADRQVRSAFFDSDVIDSGFNSQVVEAGDERVVVGRLLSRTEPEQRPFEEVKEDIRTLLVDEDAEQRRDDTFNTAYEQLLEDRDFDAAESLAKSDWVVHESQQKHDRSVDPAVLSTGFKEPLPQGGGRAIVAVDSDFTTSKYIVVVARQALADYSVLDNAIQEELTEQAESGARIRGISAFIAGLRSEASVKTERVNYP